MKDSIKALLCFIVSLLVTIIGIWGTAYFGINPRNVSQVPFFPFFPLMFIFAGPFAFVFLFAFIGIFFDEKKHNKKNC